MASSLNAAPKVCQRLMNDASNSNEMNDSKASKKRKYKTRAEQASLDESGEHNDIPGPSRRKRQRRRKNRKYKPYNKLSWQERREQEDRETRRANRVRAQRFANGQPVAPYNTTQFLMDDHDDLKDIHVPPPHNPPQLPRPRGQRCRDSSFSLDSDDDVYYSSPEDEGEFLTKEFSSAYEDLHAEQLNAQPKSKLVTDILTLEKKLELLQHELVLAKSNNKTSSEEGGSDERLVLYKGEITKLSEENNRLRAENECLRRRCFGEDIERVATSTSSVDTDSDSTASSSSCCSSSSCDRTKHRQPTNEAPEENTNQSDTLEQPVVNENQDSQSSVEANKVSQGTVDTNLNVNQDSQSSMEPTVKVTQDSQSNNNSDVTLSQSSNIDPESQVALETVKETEVKPEP